MKAVIFVFFGVMVSVVAHAGVEETAYLATPTDARAPGCSLQTIVVKSITGSMEISTATFKHLDGSSNQFTQFAHSTWCDSDVVCNSTDSGSVKGPNDGELTVGFRHKNNGAFPTTDLPGFSLVTVESAHQTCVYQLTLIEPALIE